METSFLNAMIGTNHIPYGLSLRLLSDQEDLWMMIFTWMLILIVVFVIGTWLVSLGASNYVAQSLTSLEDLTIGTQSLRQGDYSVRVAVPEEQELTELANGFNFLASNLQQTLQRLAESAKREEVLRRKTVENEMATLRSQLQPHFLFNSLSMIAQSMKKQPQEAETTLLDLSDLYHGILQSSEQRSHSLSAELAIVRGYLKIQKQRFGERLSFNIPSDNNISFVAVPPLSVFNLVENCIKHGIAPSRNGGFIEISTEQQGTLSRLLVRNSGVPLTQEIAFGVGLKNTLRRWQLLYGKEKAHFSLTKDQNGFTSAILELKQGK
ncbi:MAG: histidine kinase [Pseudobacteriovorax sp.]|nr:histidine kinase [Pseudobacteriovorax sp.]